MKKILAKDRNKVAKVLSLITEKYHTAIPIADINKVLKNFDRIIIQEDSREWNGFLCGMEGKTHFDLGIISEKNNDTFPRAPETLFLSWYRMPNTGRFEIVCYLC